MKICLLPIILVYICWSCSTDQGDVEIFQDIEVEEEQFDAEMNAEETMLFELINEYRASQGLIALEFSAQAYLLASDHNSEMIAESRLSHNGFNQRALALSRNSKAVAVGENVAKDYLNIEDCLQGWINSTVHQRSIIGDYTHSAVNISKDSEGNPYYTQLFFKK